METIQFIQITPEQLKSDILEGVKKEIDILKKEYQPKNPTEFLSRNDVAKMLKINVSSVHNWTVQGVLKAYQISGRVYYKRVEIETAIVELKK